jgi:hypothetical protein
MVQARLSFGNFQLIANNILALDPEITRCLVASNPEGSLLATSAVQQEKENFSKVIDSTSGLGTHWIVTALNSFARASPYTSEIEYVAVERKLQKALVFSWTLYSAKVVFAIGLTKKSDIIKVYGKLVTFLETI